MIKSVTQAGELKGKKVFLRADLDVSVGPGQVIQEEYRVKRQLENIKYLLDRGARVLLAGHISNIASFEPLLNQLQRILGLQIVFCKDFAAVASFWADDGNLALLDNLRLNPGEEANDPAFAQELVAGADLYVNNALAACHRTHASIATIPQLLPAYAGLLIFQEVEQLSKVLTAPAEGKVIYMGGAKSSTKVPAIRHLIDKAEAVVVGGVIAIDILKELGQDIGRSRVDGDTTELLKGLNIRDPRLIVPVDEVTDDQKILDIGPKTAAKFAALAKEAKLIIWNGPMGLFEDERYMAGTAAVAHAIAESPAQKIIGGGDTITVVDKLGLLDQMGFVSTGGGAMLTFLAGQRLPGLAALGYYE